MAERLGKYTIVLNSHPSVTGFAAVVGKTEGEGPLKDEFDFVFEDDTLGEASFEKAESALQKEAVTRALSKAGKTPDEVDFSLAGDLGKVGSRLLCELLQKDCGIDIESVHADCGLLLYDTEKQDVHAGGSGCGCGASVLNSYIMRRLESGELSRVLFVATGALMSPTSSLQGESIPSIAHAVLLSKPT